MYNKHLQGNTAFKEAAFKSIPSKVQREIRSMKGKWWSLEAEELEEMADYSDPHGLLCGLKTIYMDPEAILQHQRGMLIAANSSPICDHPDEKDA